MAQDRKNWIDLDNQTIVFSAEHRERFENGIYVSLFMQHFWAKVISRGKKKMSPRTMLSRLPPLNPHMKHMKDINNEKTRQMNWALVARELKKFEIEISSVVRELLIEGGHNELISTLVSMLVDFDKTKGCMTMERTLEATKLRLSPLLSETKKILPIAMKKSQSEGKLPPLSSISEK